MRSCHILSQFTEFAYHWLAFREGCCFARWQWSCINKRCSPFSNQNTSQQPPIMATIIQLFSGLTNQSGLFPFPTSTRSWDCSSFVHSRLIVNHVTLVRNFSKSGNGKSPPRLAFSLVLRHRPAPYVCRDDLVFDHSKRGSDPRPISAPLYSTINRSPK